MFYAVYSLLRGLKKSPKRCNLLVPLRTKFSQNRVYQISLLALLLTISKLNTTLHAQIVEMLSKARKNYKKRNNNLCVPIAYCCNFCLALYISSISSNNKNNKRGKVSLNTMKLCSYFKIIRTITQSMITYISKIPFC